MAGNSTVRLYYRLPQSLKSCAVSALAQVKKGKKYGPDFAACFEYLMGSTARDREERAREELARYLRHAGGHARFYRELMGAETCVEDLPVIDKTTVLNDFSSFTMAAPYFTGQSSGTSGQPLKVPYSRSAYQKEYAFWWYHRSYGGVKRGDRVATFAGHKIADVRDDSPPFWLHNMAENQLFFSSYHLSRKNLPHYVRQLNRFRPDFIHGYPSSISMVARHILETGARLDFRPRMIVTSSETTLDFQRRDIEQAFGAKVYIWYGNTEFCGHITECAHGRLHTQPWHSLVRIVRDNGEEARPGEQGRIVATNFTNLSLALINYDMKDLVKVSVDQTCPCGRGGLIVDYIVGRVEDYIITPEGRWVGRLDHLFKDARHVRNAQIEQSDSGSVTIRIENEPAYSRNVEKAILDEARIRLGSTIEIRFEYVREIEKLANGKFPFIIQRMKRTMAGIHSSGLI